MEFRNVYQDAALADAYSRLELANTYYLAYRDLPRILGEHVVGKTALDFGCGTGRSSRFLRSLGFRVTGVDISAAMLAKARELDPEGDYRLVAGDDFSSLAPQRFDVVLSMFTFDNISNVETKVRIFSDLRKLLSAAGKIVSVVSSPEIYVHEWASFSTRSFPENRKAKSGDVVRIVTTDFGDVPPTEDILFTDYDYRAVYQRSGLRVAAMEKPLAHGDEPYRWVNERTIAPWALYVLEPLPTASSTSHLVSVS